MKLCWKKCKNVSLERQVKSLKSSLFRPLYWLGLFSSIATLVWHTAADTVVHMKLKYSWNVPPVTLHDPCASLVSSQPRRKPAKREAKGGAEGQWGDGSLQVRGTPAQTGGIAGAPHRCLPMGLRCAVCPSLCMRASIKSHSPASLGSRGLGLMSASWHWKLVIWWLCHSGHQVSGGHTTVGVCDMADTRYKNGCGAGGSTGHTLVFSLLSQLLRFLKLSMEWHQPEEKERCVAPTCSLLWPQR